MKLVIEVDLSGDMNNCVNFHTFMAEFLEGIASVIPRADNHRFSAMFEHAPKVLPGIVLLSEARTKDAEFDDSTVEEIVVGRCMVMDEAFRTDKLAEGAVAHEQRRVATPMAIVRATP